MSLSKKNFVAILAGLITVLLVTIVGWVISFIEIRSISDSVSKGQDVFSAYSQKSHVILNQIVGMLSFLSPAIGGVVVGWISRGRKWLHGVIFGTILSIISIGIFALPLLSIPTQNSLFDSFRKSIELGVLSKVISSPIIIMLSILGCFLGELIHRIVKRESSFSFKRNVAWIIIMIIGLTAYTKYGSIIITTVIPADSYSQNQTPTRSELKKYASNKIFTDGEITQTNSKLGIIEGKVADLALRPLEGVSVFEKNRKISTRTDRDGNFNFDNLSSGPVSLIFTLAGYTSPEVGFHMYDGLKIKNGYIMKTVGSEMGGIDGIVRLNGALQENTDVFIILNKKILSTKTDNSGYYIFKEIPPTKNGDQIPIIALRDGYAPIRESTEVSSGVDTKFDFDLTTKVEVASLVGFLLLDNIDLNARITTEKDAATIKVKTNRTINTSYVGIPGFYDVLSTSQMYPFPKEIDIEISAPGYKTIVDKIIPKQGATYFKNYIMSKE